jgi:hypothetical protein
VWFVRSARNLLGQDVANISKKRSTALPQASAAKAMPMIQKNQDFSQNYLASSLRK